MQLPPLLLFGLLSICSGRQGASAIASVGETPRASGESRILSFRRTAVMDTITAVLQGTASYQAVAAPDGTFRFYHIPAGRYALTATHPVFHSVAPSPWSWATVTSPKCLLG